MTDQNQPHLSVVIPTYNEVRRIGRTLSSVHDYLNQQNYSYEVLIVDDGSTDGTQGLISQIISAWPQMKLITNSMNRGKGAMVKQGILAAVGDYVLFMDADGSTPIQEIEKLWPYINDYPVVIGSRHCPGAIIHIPQAWHRIILSRLSNLLIRWLAVPGVYDTQCGFKLFHRRPAQEIFSRVTINRFGFDFEALAIAFNLGYSFKEVGIEWHNDSGSKVRAGREALRTLRDLFKVKWNLLVGKYQ